MAKGRSIPVVLGTVTFPSRLAATNYFHAALQSYAPGDRVAPEHEALLRELLNRHPDAAAKIGDGIAHFGVIQADFMSQCFAVYRDDGSFERFSYHTCISEGAY